MNDFINSIADDCYTTFVGLEVNSVLPERDRSSCKRVEKSEDKLKRLLLCSGADFSDVILEAFDEFYAEVERQGFIFGFQYAAKLMERSIE